MKAKTVQSANPCLAGLFQTNFDIARTHGGELKIETNLGTGNKFIVSMPIS